MLDLLVGDARVLDGVVQQRRHDRILIQAEVHGDLRRCDAVRQIGRAVLALLSLVAPFGHLVGRADAVEIERMPERAQAVFQVDVHLVRVRETVLCALLFHLFFHRSILNFSSDCAAHRAQGSAAVQQAQQFGGLQIGLFGPRLDGRAVKRGGLRLQQPGLPQDGQAQAEALRLHALRTLAQDG